MNDNQSARWGILPRHISWLTVVLALLAVGTFIAVSNPEPYYRTGGGMMEYANTTTKMVPPTAAGVPIMDGGAANAPDQAQSSATYYPYPYPYPGTDVSITDTREFLKIYYNASMLTRNVQSLTRRVETTVRGYDGRIDNESVAPKYGNVSFAIPQSKYEAFRAEIESFVDSRFLTVNISSQNMLSQKVSIEEQQKQADAALANYKTVRQKIVTTHTNLVEALNTKISDPSTTPTDKSSFQLQLTNENSYYAKQLANADANIKYAQDWVKGVQTQDQTLLANVATVTGTISIQWISLWDIALLYLPGYWIPTIFTALTVLSYWHDRRRTPLAVS